MEGPRPPAPGDLSPPTSCLTELVPRSLPVISGLQLPASGLGLLRDPAACPVVSVRGRPFSRFRQRPCTSDPSGGGLVSPAAGPGCLEHAEEGGDGAQEAHQPRREAACPQETRGQPVHGVGQVGQVAQESHELRLDPGLHGPPRAPGPLAVGSKRSRSGQAPACPCWPGRAGRGVTTDPVCEQGGVLSPPEGAHVTRAQTCVESLKSTSQS